MKSLFEQMGGTYRVKNGYLIPNSTLPEEEQIEIGVWGMRHLMYIKNHRKGFYTALILDCKVNRYLPLVFLMMLICFRKIFYRFAK